MGRCDRSRSPSPERPEAGEAGCLLLLQPHPRRKAGAEIGYGRLDFHRQDGVPLLLSPWQVKQDQGCEKKPFSGCVKGIFLHL